MGRDGLDGPDGQEPDRSGTRREGSAWPLTRLTGDSWGKGRPGQSQAEAGLETDQSVAQEVRATKVRNGREQARGPRAGASTEAAGEPWTVRGAADRNRWEQTPGTEVRVRRFSLGVQSLQPGGIRNSDGTGGSHGGRRVPWRGSCQGNRRQDKTRAE
ncbi:hypothetical protein SKAU_G00352420 [Synaphobranchus kaupii]|uniref:Uncharacterized protein n=1 Tax=Synaphobranchus kaupii TaxID=118154 RepID=A0A9Q1EKM7_SYNKA|nr:hypothetical protein SKAU_G00352420 [Synaphobranchus kaupii]